MTNSLIEALQRYNAAQKAATNEAIKVRAQQIAQKYKNPVEDARTVDRLAAQLDVLFKPLIH